MLVTDVPQYNILKIDYPLQFKRICPSILTISSPTSDNSLIRDKSQSRSAKLA